MKRNEFIRRILGGLSAIAVAPSIIANIKEEIDNPGPGETVKITITKDQLDESLIKQSEIFHHYEIIEVQEDSWIIPYHYSLLAIKKEDAYVRAGDIIVFANGEKCLCVSSIKVQTSEDISYISVSSVYNERSLEIHKGDTFIIGSNYFIEGYSNDPT